MIPHRYPILLVDRVVEMRAFERAVGIKNVTINEPFFAGPFPGRPDHAGRAAGRGHGADRGRAGRRRLGDRAEGNSVYFMGDRGGPLSPAGAAGRPAPDRGHGPAQQLGVWKFGGRALVEGELAAEAEFMAKIMTG